MGFDTIEINLVVLYKRKDKNLSLVGPELICTKLYKSIMAYFCIFNTRPSKVFNYCD